MRLWFENSNGERKHLSQVFDINETWKIIDNFLKEHNYKSYYTRFWFDDSKLELWIDVGSHSEFFIITGFVDKESSFINKFLNITKGENQNG